MANKLGFQTDAEKIGLRRGKSDIRAPLIRTRTSLAAAAAAAEAGIACERSQ